MATSCVRGVMERLCLIHKKGGWKRLKKGVSAANAKERGLFKGRRFNQTAKQDIWCFGLIESQNLTLQSPPMFLLDAINVEEKSMMENGSITVNHAV
jgi:hypothetical protein